MSTPFLDYGLFKVSTDSMTLPFIPLYGVLDKTNCRGRVQTFRRLWWPSGREPQELIIQNDFQLKPLDEIRDGLGPMARRQKYPVGPFTLGCRLRMGERCFRIPIERNVVILNTVGIEISFFYKQMATITNYNYDGQEITCTSQMTNHHLNHEFLKPEFNEDNWDIWTNDAFRNMVMRSARANWPQMIPERTQYRPTNTVRVPITEFPAELFQF